MNTNLTKERTVNWEYVIGALITIGLLAYLLVALLKPEKF
ncbi:MAG: K(+)-transporting ATPase subunit F [Acidobacteriota bacterium]